MTNYIYEQLSSCTILSVAHRFSAVLAAEKAVVIEEGHVTASGTHEALLEQNKLYRALYEEYQNSQKQKGATYEA